MAKSEPIYDLTKLDFDNIVADLETIRQYNPQRFELEQLTGIVYDDFESHICIGYKDLNEDEFWVRGHFPKMPLMPGVLMCEAAAQVCTFHSAKHKLISGDKMVGFGGLDRIKFRGQVKPGDRLVICAQAKKIRINAIIVCDFQCYVGETLVAEGELRGVALPAQV